MTMYEKQTWVNGAGGDTPLNATRLNHMEDGIEAGSLKGGFGTDEVFPPNALRWSEDVQSIPNATETYINGMTGTQIDDEDLFSFENIFESTDPQYQDGAIAVTESGLYEVHWEVDWPSTAAGHRMVQVRSTSTGGPPYYDMGMYGTVAQQFSAGVNQEDQWMIGSAIVRGWAGNQVFLVVWQDSGGALDVEYAELQVLKII